MKIKELERLLTEAASNYVKDTEASYFAQCVIESYLRKTPRMNPLQDAITDLNVWKELQGNLVETVVDKESILLLNFNGLAPSLQIGRIHDELEQRARKNGIAAAGFHNSSGINTLDIWANGLAKRNMIGISMFNGGTESCVPYGGTRGVFGTNPIAYAIPTADQPIVLDMATTEIPFFEVDQAKKLALPLKELVAVDRQGKPTTNAHEALTEDGIANLLPIGGGFKGYGLVLLIEILTGSLVQSLLSTQQTSGWNTQEYGCLLIAIDISSFTDITKFKQSVSDMCKTLRSMPAAEGFDGIPIPGDRGYGKFREAMEMGECEVEAPLIEQLRWLSKNPADTLGFFT